ncbi:DUF4336 domain-containing protein [Photobacterium sp. SDRW27]|uniref:DUF4336 domain-containing protein n=1 Tax=Photobacterium obscurum TaxID=2829490 RepID=UPI0022430D67|nr:DUF4336 domain-containing protein [Photobacterium obscurum]MCW8329748.1 DUF4336 domain-containing protein [Photobacterium obscurum]
MTNLLTEYVRGEIWITDYPVHYAGLDFFSRMTVVRLIDNKLLLHSPCQIDQAMKAELAQLGEVAYIVAPGSYHHLHIISAQDVYPLAKTMICPGVEQKVPDIQFDEFLCDKVPDCWVDDFDQVLVRGTKYMWEVAFCHKPSRTLILVDLIENIGDKTQGIGWGLKIWWKLVFRMWNKPKPAPEYQLGWKDKVAARQSLLHILGWDFERVIISNGDLIENNAKEVVRLAWSVPLES